MEVYCPVSPVVSTVVVTHEPETFVAYLRSSVVSALL